jgi:predicted Zn-dependent protease
MPQQDFDDISVEFAIAIARRDAGDLPGSREVLKDLAALHPTEFGVWLILGSIQMFQEDYEAAEESFTIAVGLGPRSERASLALFHTLKHLGRVGEAFEEMRRFLALRPESHEYYLLREEMDG